MFNYGAYKMLHVMTGGLASGHLTALIYLFQPISQKIIKSSSVVKNLNITGAVLNALVSRYSAQILWKRFIA